MHFICSPSKSQQMIAGSQRELSGIIRSEALLLASARRPEFLPITPSEQLLLSGSTRPVLTSSWSWKGPDTEAVKVYAITSEHLSNKLRMFQMFSTALRRFVLLWIGVSLKRTLYQLASLAPLTSPPATL